MAELSKEEGAAIFDSFSDDQKRKAIELKSQGLSPSWAIRKVQAEAAGNKAIEEVANEPKSLEDKLAAAGMGFAEGATLDAPAAVGAIKSLAAHSMYPTQDVAGKALNTYTTESEKAAEAQQAAKEVSPEAYKAGEIAPTVIQLLAGAGLIKGGAQGLINGLGTATTAAAKEGVPGLAKGTAKGALETLKQAMASGPSKSIGSIPNDINSAVKVSGVTVSKVPGFIKLLGEGLLNKASSLTGIEAVKLKSALGILENLQPTEKVPSEVLKNLIEVSSDPQKIKQLIGAKGTITVEELNKILGMK